MKGKLKGFKKGVASFYIVAFSTLILVVVATSFATMIISEVTRTSNDDLAQSAYDSALAGVEDAKLALNVYQRCKAGNYNPPNTRINCDDVITMVEAEEKDCDMVGKILGRESDDGGYFLGEYDNNGNIMSQYYTCVTINTKLHSYAVNLSKDSSTKVIQPKLKETNKIKKVRIKWRVIGKTTSDELKQRNNYGFFKSGEVKFTTTGSLADPPMISVGIVQTANSFSLDDFEKTSGDSATDRGMVFLVPTTDKEAIKGGINQDSYIGAYRNDRNEIEKRVIVKSNDHSLKNLPVVVYCDTVNGERFACVADLELPDVIGDEGRNEDTFMVVLSYPYVTNDTTVLGAEVEFCKNDLGSGDCDAATVTGQIEIDSTGRANNLYRRVSTVLEPADTYNPYPMFALELTGSDGNGYSLQKTMTVTCEEKFDNPTGCPGN